MITNDWIKKGVIFNPENINNWIVSHAYIPTPWLKDEETIRLYLAFRDQVGIGRIGYIDVLASNPFKILKISQYPCLDIGETGTFDDNGVTPISIVENDNKLYLYYVGWQLHHKVRYFLFSGLAISKDGGESFYRYKKTPILDRTDQEFLVRCAPSVIKEKNKWHMVYAGGDKNIILNKKIVPTYSLKYLSSDDGVNWDKNISIDVLTPVENVEFGFGRPYFIKDQNIYKIWYSIRDLKEGYKLGYAESDDLKRWTRRDDDILYLNEDMQEYDNQMRGFSSIVITKYCNYLFYNGNDFGRTGVCCAFQK
ncbi:hypothetical protein SZ25_00447 [Candidatus Arcanobacter lacustris]|uniref:Glycosyl hydrolase family 32 N-terminal domain-containing protein n=1 Tax=Candidatus Arcanibacter lacustris TaxID=1607817 RepID=A0A0F5MQW7_9RICK|nr:hypothetical protein SZ25_00447 [Candidatus Arcanobacter lacustris]